MSAILAFLVGRLSSQTKAIKPTAARRFRPKRYDKEIMVSGTIEDNFLIFGNLANLDFEFPQENSAL